VHRRRRHLLVGALAVLAGAAFVAWIAQAPRGTPERTDVGEESPTEPTGPLLAANDRESAEGYRMEDGVAVPRGRVSDATGAGVVVVRVVDEQDRPGPGRSLHASITEWDTRPARPVWRPRALQTRRTDDAGVARWAGLAEGRTVEVRTNPDVRWTFGIVHVVVGATVATLRIAALEPVTIRVTDAEGRSLPKASVTLYAPPAADADDGLRVNPGRQRIYPPYGQGRGIAGARSDEAGVASLSLRPDVAAGQLWVSADGFAPWLDPGWSRRNTEVRLERAREIEGVVRDTKGEILADGVIHWETPQGIRGEDPVEYDGAFRIAGLPSGSIRLEWRLPDAPGLDGRNVQHANAGDDSVTFVVTLGADLSVQIDGWPRTVGEAFLTPQDGQRFEFARLRADIDLEGNARFQGLTPDRPYVLWVPPRWGAPAGQDESAAPGTVYRMGVTASAETLTVPFEPGRTVRGVIDLTGTDAVERSLRRWPWASVAVRGPGILLPGSTDRARSDASEIPFEIAGVPKGESTIVATMTVDYAEDTPSTHWIGEASVPSDDEPVRVRLRPAPAEEGR
jgi:hypothetical protein